MTLTLLSVAKQESSVRTLKIGLQTMAEHDKVFDETTSRNTSIEIPPAEKLRKERI